LALLTEARLLLKAACLTVIMCAFPSSHKSALKNADS
jgi:hypothetical protein